MTSIERLWKTGIRRIGSNQKGFRYRTHKGATPGAADMLRIENLKIPPAWNKVAINSAASGRVQAIGKDAAGRWQYIYHGNHVRKQEKKKFERLLAFARGLPALRKTIASKLRQPGLGRERVMACIMRILTTSFMRPGSEIYAHENGSYGLSTLRSRHVKARGNHVVFDFPGKSGVHQHRELHDRQVASVVKELLKQPGRDLFRYKDESGPLISVKRSHINSFIKEVMGDRFTAKDFRTWGGTLVCACALARLSEENDVNAVDIKRKISAAVNETASVLGNTPSVCRSAYIHPSLIRSFQQGDAIERYFSTVDDFVAYRGVALHPAERALLRFLREHSL